MTGRQKPSIETLRGAVRQRVAETTIRYTAEEIGLTSHSGLDDFARGRTKSLHSGTRDLLTAWYYRNVGAPPRVTADEVAAAIATLRAYWNDESKPRSIRERRKRNVIERLSAPAED